MEPTTIAIIAGAGALLLFAIFCVLYFNKELRHLSGRIKAVGKDGLLLGDSQPKAQDNPSANQTVPFEKQLDTLSRSAVLIAREDTICDQLKAKGITQDADKVKMLVRALAWVSLAGEFDSLSLTIYGSQLEFLIALNAAPEETKLDKVKAWYKNNVQPTHEALRGVTFDTYFGYITSNGLAVISGENVLITPYSKEFMQYLVRTGKTYPRRN